MVEGNRSHKKVVKPLHSVKRPGIGVGPNIPAFLHPPFLTLVILVLSGIKQAQVCCLAHCTYFQLLAHVLGDLSYCQVKSCSSLTYLFFFVGSSLIENIRV